MGILSAGQERPSTLPKREARGVAQQDRIGLERMKDVELISCEQLPNTKESKEPKIIGYIDITKGDLKPLDATMETRGLLNGGFHFHGTGIALGGLRLVKGLNPTVKHEVTFTDRNIFTCETAMCIDGELVCWISDESLEAANMTFEVTGD